MSTAGTVLCTAAGTGLIALAGRDIFDALFHPEGRAALSRVLMRGVWATFRRAGASRPGPSPLAGPVVLVVVIAAWATALAVGWALVFVPHIDDGFRFATGEDTGSADFVDALYVSLVTLTTVGYGDVTPAEDWLRIVTPLEALLGFGLLSASISWLLLLYPVLSRRRSLAYEVFLLTQAERDAGLAVEQLGHEAVESLLAELTSRLVAVERDMVSFPVTYYFSESDERFALAANAGHLLDLARRAAKDDMPARVRLRSYMLLAALEDFAGTTAVRFHGRHSDRVDEVLRAYARDQGR